MQKPLMDAQPAFFFIAHKPTSLGWYHPQWIGPSYINKENALEVCSQADPMGVASHLRFPTF